jgi:ribonuclease Z
MVCWRGLGEVGPEFILSLLVAVTDPYRYVVEEYPVPGRLNMDKLRERGLPPGPKYKTLKLGGSVELPNGEMLHASEVRGNAT